MNKQQRKAYMNLIVDLQNYEVNQSQDHITITGFFTTHTEFMKHISKLSERISENLQTSMIRKCISVQLNRSV